VAGSSQSFRDQYHYHLGSTPIHSCFFLVQEDRLGSFDELEASTIFLVQVPVIYVEDDGANALNFLMKFAIAVELDMRQRIV
jgi:hypothetical protein